MFLERFHANFPQVQTHIQTGDPGLSIERVMKKQVDVSIAVKAQDFPKELDFTLLDTLPLVMIVPTTSSIKQLSDIDWQSQPFILPDVGHAKCLVNDWLAKHRIKPNVYASIGGNEAMVSMVALGCGIAIVPEIVLQYSAVHHKVNKVPSY